MVSAVKILFNAKAGGPLGRLILIMLADGVDPDGFCPVIKERLAARCESTPDAIEKWLRRFEKRGLLKQVKNYNCGGRYYDGVIINTEREAA